ncbi:hypothetical protein [Azohydromonas sp.]|uniref:hypothetical protein n=1 Tax=Azohydromonas sp. TaxID=1872666 RepID=UPI002C86FE91|nr:hypothetical protein [Azohydromonas sp.]HMM87173.1 hypothetical protein [Azohydromonas sp.]
MMWKTFGLALVLATSTSAWAQSKQDLVKKVLQLQQPGIENAARMVAEQPALMMMQQAAIALRSRVPEDKREAVAREIQADARKYADEAVPLLRQQAVKLAPTTIGPILEKEFSVEELKQLVSILESPVNRKFQQLGGDMQRALNEKLVADTRDEIEPKLRALQQSVGERLRVGAAGPGAPASAPR